MTIRLVKRNQETKAKKENIETPSPNRLLESTQAWVEEYRAKKARNNAALLAIVRSN